MNIIRGFKKIRQSWDPFLATRIHELFSQAGARDVELQPVGLCRYQGNGPLLPTHALPFWPFEHEVFAKQGQELRELGILTDAIVAKVDAELIAWRQHPHAICLRAGLFVVGRANETA